jgi:hypothetical protein
LPWQISGSTVIRDSNWAFDMLSIYTGG